MVKFRNFLLLSLLFSTLSMGITMTLVKAELNPIAYRYDNLKESPAISITSAEDFSTYGIPGDGSPENPYLIENLRFSQFIDRRVSDSANAITINGIVGDIVIRNNFFRMDRVKMRSGFNPGMIDLQNIEGSVTIEDSYFYEWDNNSYALYMKSVYAISVDYLLIQNNYFQKEDWGKNLILSDINKLSIVGNTAITDSYSLISNVDVLEIYNNTGIVNEELLDIEELTYAYNEINGEVKLLNVSSGDISDNTFVQGDIQLKLGWDISNLTITSNSFVRASYKTGFGGACCGNSILVLGISSNVIISDNLFQDAGSYAIEIISDSLQNYTISNNSFYNNGWEKQTESQAFSSSQGVLFEGNYWDDSTGGPYSIAGEAGLKDNTPADKAYHEKFDTQSLQLTTEPTPFPLTVIFSSLIAVVVFRYKLANKI